MLLVWVYMFQNASWPLAAGVGERPEAAHARGIAVNRLRYLYTILGGALVGIGGAAFTPRREARMVVPAHPQLRLDRPRHRHLRRLASASGGAGVLLFGFLQWLALDLQGLFPNLTQVLPIMPFALMIFALVLVNANSIREWADRHPRWGSLVLGDAPSAIGRHFKAE